MNNKQALTSRPATMRFAALTILVLLVAPAAPAEIPSQTTFASADAASRALYDAVKKHDEESIGQILGATQSLAEKRDEERLEREQFAQKYAEMHRLGRERNGRMMLYVGAENWPFPIPLVSHNGAWRFDAAAGEQEILFRRIGENELTAIGICGDLAKAAQNSQAHQDDDLLSTLLVDAENGGTPTLYRGYRFRVLNRGSADFAVIAYPEAYRSSGVMTFIVSRRAVVYAKDLGAATKEVANAMTGYHLDRSWKKEAASGAP